MSFVNYTHLKMILYCEKLLQIKNNLFPSILAYNRNENRLGQCEWSLETDSVLSDKQQLSERVDNSACTRSYCL